MKFIEEPQNAELKNQIDSLQKNKDMVALQKLAEKLELMIDSAYAINNTVFKFSDEQRQVYKTIGGTPHLDGSYTVYGEVILGLDVVDRIAEKETGKNDRPLENVRMKMLMIQKINK